MIPFGPVPSRRLGRSLGINNIPPKSCSYACVYCQAGRTSDRTIERRAFYGADAVIQAVTRHVVAAGGSAAIDALTFVPDGEPTLDRDLGAEIDGVLSLGIPVAVITNGTLLGRRDVRAELSRAHVVSVKVDAIEERAWYRVNRPHPALTLEALLDGILDFASTFPGRLLTETMLVEGVNDDPRALEDMAVFLARLKPAKAWLAAPLRPPAVEGTRVPTPEVFARAQRLLQAAGTRVGVLGALEQGRYEQVGEVVEDLVAILAVHPMPEPAARDFLERAGEDAALLQALVDQGRLVHRVQGDVTFVTLGERGAHSKSS